MEITLHGQARGHIWMPYAECWHDFSVTRTVNQPVECCKWNTAPAFTDIREMFLAATDCGDFQNLLIDWCKLSVRRLNTTTEGSSTKTLLQTWSREVRPSAHRDCFTKAQEGPYYADWDEPEE